VVDVTPGKVALGADGPSVVVAVAVVVEARAERVPERR